jgi:hypothetical protein
MVVVIQVRWLRLRRSLVLKAVSLQLGTRLLGSDARLLRET